MIGVVWFTRTAFVNKKIPLSLSIFLAFRTAGTSRIDDPDSLQFMWHRNPHQNVLQSFSETSSRALASSGGRKKD
jgi:hypothetical protein